MNTTLPGADGIYGTADDKPGSSRAPTDVMGTPDDIYTFGNQATPTKASNSSSTIPGLPQSLFIPNVTPDNGLSAPFNSFFTIFGQFFDHGLDLITKNGPDQRLRVHPAGAGRSALRAGQPKQLHGR